MQYVGIDFGTTNSAIAVADEAGQTRLVGFREPDGRRSDVWRSVIYFEPTVEAGHSGICAGGAAIGRYLENDGEGRLIQSVKSHLASAHFARTSILNRNWTLPELIAAFLKQARSAVDIDLGRRAVVGRPVRYWGAESPADDERARTRMAEALSLAGFDDVIFEFEPVAAASAYAARIDHDELVLVADFGGGTSDFTVVRVGPTVTPGDPAAILATGGVGISGDAFDARFIDHVVAPMLGKGSSYRDEFGAEAPVPSWIFSKLRRWHHLSFLKDGKTTALLERIEAGANAAPEIRALREVVEEDMGLALHRAVEHSKVELSAVPTTGFALHKHDVRLGAQVGRDDFQRWIAPDVDAIESIVNQVLAQAGVQAGQIDRVFATGGSSFVPLVRARLAQLFGEQRLVGGGELTSVATGLALRARQLFTE